MAEVTDFYHVIVLLSPTISGGSKTMNYQFKLSSPMILYYLASQVLFYWVGPFPSYLYLHNSFMRIRGNELG